jgi:hypothetical protein
MQIPTSGIDGPPQVSHQIGGGDTNDFESKIVHLLWGRHNRRFERSRATCARCRFVGPPYDGTYSGPFATSMPEAELDECRSNLPVVDRTARRHASDNSRRNRQGSKWRRRNFDPVTSHQMQERPSSACLTEQRRKRPEPFLLFSKRRHRDQLG